MCLYVRYIEGRTANDYLNHINLFFGEAGRLYADAKGIVSEEVLSQIKNSDDGAVIDEIVSEGIGNYIRFFGIDSALIKVI